MNREYMSSCLREIKRNCQNNIYSNLPSDASALAYEQTHIKIGLEIYPVLYEIREAFIISELKKEI